jgi:uncharacterized repeat protein (TIGR01451 family)
VSCPAGAASLAPAATVTCTATYVVTQADMDAGSFSNTATATGTSPAGAAVTSPTSTVKLTATPAAALTLVKTASPAGPAVFNSGDKLTFSYLITNTGNVTESATGISEGAFTGTGAISAVTCPAGAASLAPAATVTCTATYTLTQADIDAGSVSNTATATGKTPAGATTTSAASTVKVVETSAPALTLVKSASPTSVTTAGQTIAFSYLVTNTGNVTEKTVGIVEGTFTGSGVLSAVTCPAGALSLAPGAQVSCTASYGATQADINAGTISNTATATGKTPTLATTTSPASTVQVTTTAGPALSVVKSALPATVTKAGTSVTFSYLVTNTGNVTEKTIAIAEGTFTGTGTLSAVACPAGAASLAPNATVTCTATYPVTQADIDAGSISNTATATGKNPSGGTTTSAPSTVKVTAAPAPALTVSKSAAPATVTKAGATVTFSYLVTNTGNVTQKTVGIVEGAFTGTGTLSAVTCPAGAASLAPAGTVTCTATYGVTQADIDAGTISNTATATGKDPAGGTTASAPSTAKFTATSAAALTVVKSATPAGPAVFNAGDAVTFSYLVTNTGNVTESTVGIVEGAFTGTGALAPVTCPGGAATLAPAATVTCTATYKLTQADVDAGSVSNTATATGKTPTGAATTSLPSTVKVTETPAGALTVVKTASPTSVATAGTMVTFSYLVTNTGNVTEKTVVIVEGAFTGSGTVSAVTCPAGAASLAPAATVTCTSTYKVTQADINAGSVSNTATATGKTPTGATATSPPSTVKVTTTAGPALSLVKSASPASVTAAGQKVTFSYLVTNTGNVTDTAITIHEGTFTGSGAAPAVTCPAGAASLAPAATVTCTATYTTTQADIDAGSLANTATATGNDPSNNLVTSPASTVTVPATSAPSLTLVKSASPTAVTKTGNTVTFSYVVTNTGNVTEKTIAIAEGTFSGTGTLSAVSCPTGAASLAPAATVTCTATYAVTQADMDAGSFSNTAMATGVTPTGATTTSPTSTVKVSATATPALTVVKSASPAGPAVFKAGDSITFSYLVTNTGNVTEKTVGITEGTFTGTGALSAVTCPGGAASLAPAATVTCTATYAVTQADIDAGSLSNTATATGKTPAGATTTSPASTVKVTMTPAGALTLVKSVSPLNVTAAGQKVTFSFLVTNTGNVTEKTISIVEGTFTGSGALSAVTCPAGAASLAPAATVTCAATYTATQTDVNVGSVSNTATATGKTSAGAAATSPPSTATLTTVAGPALTVAKTASPTTVTKAGTVVTFSYLVTNTGNVTEKTVGITEGTFTGTGTLSAVTCPAGAASMVPGATVTCTATYPVTQADVDAGSFANTATATGKDPSGGTTVSPPSTATVTATATPALTLVKSAAPATVTKAGNSVTFSYLVTNTGNVTEKTVAIVEGAFTGTGALSTVTCPAGAASLAPGGTVTCTATYAVTQADLDAGSISNTATATSLAPGGGTVTSAPSTAKVAATPAGALTVVKSAAPAGPAVFKAGDSITFSYLVTNTGNVTQKTVAIVEGTFTGTGTPPAVTCPGGAASLAPGTTVTCTATYVLTQIDVDAGSISNTATATGKTPAGATTTSPASTVKVTETPAAALTVVKSASPQNVTAASQKVTFSYLVTNTGNVTEKTVAIVEGTFTGAGALSAVSCPAGAASLAPGATVTCTATYTVTQADINASAFANTATATGKTPANVTTTSPASTVTVTTTSGPALTLVKSASPTTITKAGTKVTYSFLVTNTGNVTDTAIAIHETSFTGTGALSAITCPAGAASLAPNATVTCTATYTVTQADVDAGSIVNTATATGNDPGGNPVTSPTSTATVTATAAGALTIVKSANPATVSTAGQTVTFSYLITNTGNVTERFVGVSEGAFSGTGTLSGVSCPTGAASLAPAATVTCSATYAVTQADIDAGSISNTATATGTTPGGAATTSAPSTAKVTATSAPALTVVKSAVPAGPAVFKAGDSITFSFLVTNTGNVTEKTIVIAEGAFTGTGTMSAVACPGGASPLAPAATVTCTATYVLTQADIDAGSVSNTATATGKTPAGATTTSPASTVKVTETPGAALTLVKSATPTSVATTGQKVTFSYLVTNTGNVTEKTVAITEGAFTGSGALSVVTCPSGTASLAPNASLTCTATYTVTQADINAGSVANTATVTGKTPAGATTTSAPSTATVVTTAGPALSLVKSASPATVTAAGQKVTFAFLVTNTGNVTEKTIGIAEGTFTGTGTLSAVTCPAGAASLAPNATVTCTSTYTVTQADVDTGSVTNTASAFGKDPSGGTTTSPASTVKVPATASPALTVVKTASPTTVTKAGNAVTFSYLVTNTGNVTEKTVAITEGAFTGSGTLSAVTCPGGATSLAPAATVTCTATYAVTQADVDAGSVTNTATATGIDPAGATVTSPPSSTKLTATAAPALTVVKSATPAGPAVFHAGDLETFSYLVANTGNVTEKTVGITEGAFTGTGAISGVTCPAGATSLAPAATVTCTATYVLTQADIDTGSISNTAIATGKTPAGATTTSPPSTVKVTGTPAGALTLAKSAAPTSVATAGQKVTFSYLVTNSGNVTEKTIAIVEGTFTGSGSVSAVTCPAGAVSLAPNATVTCTATYNVTQADINGGSIANTATATGKTPAGLTTTSPKSTVTVTTTAGPALTLVKSVSPTTATKAGQKVTYSFLVTNSGNVTTTNVGIAETAFTGTGAISAVTCPAGAASMAPGATVTCTATYTVTQADVDAGSVSNTADATGTDPGGHAVVSPTSTAKVTATAAPALTLLKTALPTAVTKAGQTITYSYLVTNTGNVTESAVAIAEGAFTGIGTLPAATCPAGAASLAPGATVTCTATYPVLQADIDAGSVSNTATATGQPPAGGTTSSAPSTVKVTAAPAPALTLTKSASPKTVTAAGQSVTYSFLVTNMGNVTESSIAIAEGGFTGTGTLSAATCPGVLPSLAPGASVTCTANYPFTQADMDAGSVSNTATATGKTPAGATTTSPPSTAKVTATAAGALTVVKSASPTTVATAGQKVTFSFLVTNTGNVTEKTIAIVEGTFTGSGALSAVTCPAGAASLAPAATVTCTATYTVTQTDINAGSVSNTATATGKTPAGATTTSLPSTTSVTTTAGPALTLVKSASPQTVSAAGQKVTYSFLVTNSGNVTEKNVAIVEGAFDGSGALSVVTCPAAAASMAPGVTVTCTATYTVTQADINAGSVSNTATATGKDPASSTTTSAPSTAKVTASGGAGLTLTKSVTPATVTKAGTTVTYSYLITNTGNVTLTTAGVVEGTFTGTGALSAVACPAGAASLAPGAHITCTATYLITQADIDTGSVANTATATATNPASNPVASAPSTATVTATAAPALTVVKSAAPTTVTTAGQTITFSYLVTNTGNVTAKTVDIVEGAFTGSGALSAVACPAGAASLAPGATVTCTATYTATQADIDAGSVSNTAKATAINPAGGAITSAPSTAKVTAPATPALTIVKTASPSGPAVFHAGDTVTYTYAVTNTGNVTEKTVGIVEGTFTGTGVLSAVTCPAGAATLAPGASVSCTATYKLTQADIDTGSIANTATATGKTPAGATTTSLPSTVKVTVTPAATLTIAKTASPTNVTSAGAKVTYSFLITNTGNVTEKNVTVVETSFTGSGALSALSCPTGALSMAPNATVTCTATYAVTQADVNSGSISNTATATGKTPAGATTTSAPSTATVTSTTGPALTLHKTASPATVTKAGTTVTYSYLITNTGNVTLTAASVAETAFSGTGALSTITCPAGATSLLPGAHVTCTATYKVTQADVDAGSVTNTATATGTDPTNKPVTSTPSTAKVTAAATPALTIKKTASPSGPAPLQAGQPVAYSFLVTNTGNVTLSGVAVVEGTFTGSGSLSPVTCPAGVASMAPGASVTCTANYVITAADVTSGHVANTATATGNPPGGGGAVTSPPSSTSIPAAPAPAPALTILKTATPAGPHAFKAGQVITYSYLITNSGNVPLTKVAVKEGAFTGSGHLSSATCPAGADKLAVGASVTCSAKYTLTQSDINHGTVSNTARATGTPPVGDGAPITSAPSTVSVPAVAHAALHLLKTATPDRMSEVGQEITYSFVVTNIGNVRITNTEIVDTDFSGAGHLSAVSCPAKVASIEPGHAVTCTATYKVTQADIDAGSLSNTATATGTSPSGVKVTANHSSAVLHDATSSGLGLVKTGHGEDANNDGVVDAGDLIHWKIVVTNLGGTTVSSIVVKDASAGAVKCPKTSLAPGASMTCTVGSHTVTDADSKAGIVKNTATAGGDVMGGTPIEAPAAHASVKVAPTPVPVKHTSGSLPFTGFALTLRLLAGGILLVLFGGIMQVMGRGRRRRS